MILENHPLKMYNTFGINVNAKYFADCSSTLEIINVLKAYTKPRISILILGGGSNVLFTQNFDGLVLKVGTKGIEKNFENSEFVKLKVSAGENWDEFVDYCVKQDYRGVENLSAIPGNVGSCPIQNIGAYGMEVKDTIESVDILELEGFNERTVVNADCNFGYRDSIFKRELKGKVVILAVNFILSKRAEFVLNYGNVEEELKKYDDINLMTVRDAIVQIRKRKLPDPAVAGNAGSFFKNPVIPAIQAIQIKKSYPKLPHFMYGQRKVKIPAAWLIEQCGWKGKKMGAAAVHENQPLVIVNQGNAGGADILKLAQAVKDSVMNKFKINLEFEVNIF